MTTTIEQVHQWRQVRSEHERIEFKEAKEQFDFRTLCEYCVAIANEGGGHLILGVANKPPRPIVGTKAFADRVKITAQLFEKLSFRVDVEELYDTGRRILVFGIPARPVGTAYSLDGRYLMRSGESVVAMSEDRLRTIFGEGAAPPRGDTVPTGAQSHEQTLAFNLLDRVPPRAAFPRRCVYVWPYSSPRPVFWPQRAGRRRVRKHSSDFCQP